MPEYVKCWDCKAFEQDAEDFKTGLCRRRPPIAHATERDGMTYYEGVWPIVYDADHQGCFDGISKDKP